MPVQYYFDNLDPTSFQRLVNAALVARYGERIRLLPLRGKDGGRDAETVPHSPLYELIVGEEKTSSVLGHRAGRYVFQVKHHRTADRSPSSARLAVISDFAEELAENILSRSGPDAVQSFFLITNVSGSKDAISKLDEKRAHILGGGKQIHADVLWQEHFTAWLDQCPQIWKCFPEIFAGGVVPQLGHIAAADSQALTRAIRLAIRAQFQRDGVVRFRQINLEQRLSRLFVDLELAPQGLPVRYRYGRSTMSAPQIIDSNGDYLYFQESSGISSLEFFTDERGDPLNKLILEGGPGQGKSTLTQMLVQLYRTQLLGEPEDRSRAWPMPAKARLPLRIELRAFSEWLADSNRSVEQYLVEVFSTDSGGAQVTVEQFHTAVEGSPVLMVFDGLDEVGSDDLRKHVAAKILQFVERLVSDLHCDLRTIVTSRPPAVAGHADRLPGFARVQLLPLRRHKVDEYVQRWTEVQCSDRTDRERVVGSFTKRRDEQHVNALVTNPMQLTVLLHFIRLKGEAFPDRRAELYKEYFKTVIDRDVEKSPRLRQNRDDIEALHEVLAFEIHSRAESNQRQSTLGRDELLAIVREWLTAQGGPPKTAEELFRLGEERLGLIVALQGEGAHVRYGFEVQPVREYFAAAFINDKCETNAHEIFQLMIRRSFWREVALFLAGLRRANEKADLLSRARNLDDDPEIGWRQEGRAVVLQLLQEGVLTSPGHVCRDAVSWLLAALDPTSNNAINTPKSIVGSLPKLINQCQNPQHRSTLMTYLDRMLESSDISTISDILSVSSRSLPKSTVEEYILQYPLTRTSVAARVKLLWPARDGLNVANFVNQFENTKSELHHGWAAAWYSAVSCDPTLANLEITGRHQELLLEQFAFEALDIPLMHPDGSTTVKMMSSYAVWTLWRALQILCGGLAQEQSAGRNGESVELMPGPTKINYEGLSTDVASGIALLLESVSSAAEHMRKGHRGSRALTPVVETLDRLLARDGLVGWVACRCATTLLECSELPQYISTSRYVFSARSRFAALRRTEVWTRLRRSLTGYFRCALPADLDGAGRSLASRIVRLRLSRAVPSHVRIDGVLQSVPEMLLKRVISGIQPPFAWVERAPVARYWLKDLLRVPPEQLPPVLASLSAARVLPTAPPRNLSLLQMKRVISAISRSEEPSILAGGLGVLLGSKFLNLTKTETVLRMLEADARFADNGSLLFTVPQQQREYPAAVVDVATAIVHGRAALSRSTCLAAARFLAEARSDKLPPLREVLRS